MHSLGLANCLWVEQMKACILWVLLLLRCLGAFSEWADNGKQKLGGKKTPSNFFPIAKAIVQARIFKLFLLHLAQGKFKQHVWYLRVFKDQQNGSKMALELVKKAPTDQSKDSSLIIRSHILERKKKKQRHKLFPDLYKCVPARTTH